MRRAVAGTVLVLAAAAAALAGEVEDALERARAALARGEPAAAVREAERARDLAPRRADVAYQLGRAHEENGSAADAIAFYAEVARLDPAGLGKAARGDEARLRARRLQVELEMAEEEERAGRFEPAMVAYERAFELARPDDAAGRARARDGQARCAARRLAAGAMKDRPAAPTVAVVPIAGASPASPLGEVAQALEAALVNAFRGLGATVVGPAMRAEAALVVIGIAGQRIVLRVEDRAAGGVLLGSIPVRPLLGGVGAFDLPDPIALDVSIEAERDDAARRRSPERVHVSEGSVLRSGDRFRIRVRTSREAHVYAFVFDSQGRATLLYPGTERLFPDLAAAGVTTPNPVPGGRDLLVPPPPPRGQPYWFFLDEDTGRETFYVAASVAPLDDVNELVKEIERSGEAGLAAARGLAAALERRGAGTRVEEGEREAGGAAPSHAEVLRGRGCVVRHVTVEHR